MIKLRIQEIAKEKGLNQSQLQIKAGVTPQLLNRYWHSHTQSVLEQNQESAISGEWHSGGKTIKHVLDAAGRRVFYEAFRTKGSFITCPDCPH